MCGFAKHSVLCHNTARSRERVKGYGGTLWRNRKESGKSDGVRFGHHSQCHPRTSRPPQSQTELQMRG